MHHNIPRGEMLTSRPLLHRKNPHQSGGGRLEDPEVPARGNAPAALTASTMTLGSRIYGQFASTIPVIWSIGYMVIPDTWSILAGPEADLVSGAHCICNCTDYEIEVLELLH